MTTQMQVQLSGINLRGLRSLTAIARCSDSSVSMISKVFNPSSPITPSYEMAVRIAACLGCPLEDLEKLLAGMGKRVRVPVGV
jgi:transcriptional regulator with XRE-family HTH domain